ncbi:MAG: 4-hydroxy-tetrahydrodipicolinate synthase [Clostridia bacterium]|nr:4-hydroxy-tetrahydrodipicolinate synthase [Clostridia bacterium]
MKCLFEGVAVAIVTPFKCGKVDNLALEKLIEKNICEGAKAIVVLGTTGEGSTITKAERKDLIKFTKKVIAGRAKLIVGTGNNNFELAYDYTLMAKQLGVDGALVVTPYYNKTTQTGLIEYYSRLCEIGIPIIMYNVPSRTGLILELDTIKELCSCEMIYGIKESTCDIQRITVLAKLYRDKIALYSGEDDLNYIFYCLGGQGAICVTANAYCSEVQKVYDLVKLGLYDDALAVQENLDGINKALFIETNPIPVKYLLSQMGLCENELRMPLVPLSAKARGRVDEEMAKLSI